MPPDWLAFVFPLACLPGLVWVTYWSILKGSWVSDDLLGIATYDGKLQRPLSWHNAFKWFRYHAAKVPNPNTNWKAEKQSPYLSSPRAHHRLSLWGFSGVSILLYLFLKQLLPEPLAFSATLLWVVHPLGVQTVGWISGIGYIFSTFFMLIGLNLVLLAAQLGWTVTPLGALATFLGFGFWQWMAVECQFATVGATGILLLLHQWPYAILSGLISVYGCVNTLREAVSLRRKVFHEQQMGQSTTFSPRKLIVVLKTLYYDVKLACFPRRLGLYHTFCYHYELPYVETEDRYWIGGLLLLLVGGIGVIFGPFSLQLGCLWILAFLILFLNWITANQFVVDRYVWLPSFGVCLLAATLLPPWSFWMLMGVALMRTWVHLPTYDSEEKFYLSNIWNFEQSEVAYGNLGVTYLGKGWIGSALESWIRGIHLNPEYDVCWYNLSSMFKTRGPLNPNYAPLFYQLLPKEVVEAALVRDPARNHLYLAHYCLNRAVKARTCHFPKPWEQELLALTQELSRPLGSAGILASLVQPLLTAALT